MWMEMSFPSASAAFRRTPLLESCRALVKVVCSWGRKGFRAIPTYGKNPHQKTMVVVDPKDSVHYRHESKQSQTTMS
jgi:hypothetical protein